MSATEFGRNFSAVLESVDNGETVVITRGGHRVATVAPAPRLNGAALAELLQNWHANPALNDTWAPNVAEARRTMNVADELDRDQWQN
jgi:prevent-host-death family protein